MEPDVLNFEEEIRQLDEMIYKLMGRREFLVAARDRGYEIRKRAPATEPVTDGVQSGETLPANNKE